MEDRVDCNRAPLDVADHIESAQDARDLAAREHGSEKYEGFIAELSGIAAGRIERFGVGPDSQARVAARAERSRTGDSFQAAMMAQAYSQPVTFSVGGRNVSMELSDVRGIASDRYNHYATQLRQLKNQGADQEKIKAAQQRMDAYRDLMDLTDDVAAGKASPDAINSHIQKNDIGQEIVDTGLAKPDVVVTYTAPQAAETATAGAHAQQSADELNAGFVDSMFGSPRPPS